MRQLRVKILPGMGSSDGSWEVLNFDDFLVRHAPHLSMHVICTKQFPPYHILNEELRTGGGDLGMSGGSHWKPFEISEDEYKELREEMITSPKHDLEYDSALEDRATLKKWCGAVMSHHNPRRRDGA